MKTFHVSCLLDDSELNLEYVDVITVIADNDFEAREIAEEHSDVLQAYAVIELF